MQLSRSWIGGESQYQRGYKLSLDQEQFKRLMESVSLGKEQWELLIRIDENTKNMKREFSEHLQSDAAEIALVKGSLSKVHVRIDNVSTEVRDFRNKVVGAIALATVLISGLQLFLSVRSSFSKESVAHADTVRNT